MIRSFRCTETEKIFAGIHSKRFQSIEKIALRKLIHVNRAASLADLAGIPGNRFEKLQGDRDRQYSIRINDQYRICFAWSEDQHAEGIEIVDYH